MRSNGSPIHEITSISGVGFGFLSLIVGVHRTWISKRDAIARVCHMLESLAGVKRFHGAFPHFVNTSSGKTIPFAKYDDGGDLVETALLVQAAYLRARVLQRRDTQGRVSAVATYPHMC